ncbi:MAG: OprO/OprP family phosphate-selective porin [Burkholderiaceae bacterium]|nr:OprO/OprP family phosphate-selective porin [Burkholderiaceae bacterium]
MKQVKFPARKATSVAVVILCLGASATAFAQVEAKVTGRVQFDARNISNDYNASVDRDSSSVGDAFEVRRARVGVSGKINKDISYEVVGNGVGKSTNWIDTAYGNYGFNKKAQVRVGRFKQPFSLEEQTSSNNIDFMERSYGNQMVPGKRLGAMMHGAPMKGLTYAASVYQDGFNEITNQSSIGSKAAARFTLNLAELQDIKDTVLHVGAGYTGGESRVVPVNSGNTSSSPDETTRATIVALRSENRGQSNVYRAQIGGDKLRTSATASTAFGYNVTANNAITINQKLRGIELAGARGPFKFQMETFNSKYDASGTVQDLDSIGAGEAHAMGVQVKAEYMEFMYNITGESWADAYKGGAFGGIKPKSIFMKDYGGVVGNGTGAWQVGFRTSKYTSNQAVSSSTCTTTGSCVSTVTTGTTAYGSRVQNSETARTNTYALNWILNPNARVMFNYAETKFGHNIVMLDTNSSTSGAYTGGATDKERVISVRSQFNF